MEPVKHTILHLSDLHFGKMQPDAWSNLTDRISRIRPIPEIIIISGDVCDCPIFHYRKFKVAKEKIVDLAKLCNADVFIAPGNHDVGIFGSLYLGSLTRWRFKKWFKTELLEKSVFITSLDREHILNILKKYKLLIVPFDSTRKLFISSGEIEKKEIDELDNLLGEARDIESIHGQRIAIVHHHPIPVPSKDGDNWREPFLVFKNAGYFVSELYKQRFDILLHGHKHIPSFCKISLEKKDVKAKELTVMGAGSSTSEPPPNESNNYNVIYIHENGEANIVQFFFGAGSASHEDPISYRNHDERKKAVYLNSVELQGFSCKLLEKKISILKKDSARTTVKCSKLNVVKGGLIKTHRPFRAEVDSGRVYNPRLSETAENRRYTLVMDREKSDSKKKIGRIQLGSISADDSEINYSWEFRARNAFALNRKEYARRKNGAEGFEEFTSFDILFPCDRLKMRVAFPKKLAEYLEKENPRLNIYYNPHLMHARRDNEGELEVNASRQGKWYFDARMTDFGEENLEKVGKRTWELKVAYPLVGYKYEIRWKLPD